MLKKSTPQIWVTLKTDWNRFISTNLNFINISPVYETVHTNKLQSSYIFINKELKDGNIINANQDMFMENVSQITWWD